MCGSKGYPVRIDRPGGGHNGDQTNLVRGYVATFDCATARFHANFPWIKSYDRYRQWLLKFCGVDTYHMFISGDTTVWHCSTTAYIPTGHMRDDDAGLPNAAGPHRITADLTLIAGCCNAERGRPAAVPHLWA